MKAWSGAPFSHALGAVAWWVKGVMIFSLLFGLASASLGPQQLLTVSSLLWM